MGCRNRGVVEDDGAVVASLSDALLFTTMCIIGLPVDVHVKDGSIYSGIFYTACVEDDYAIVLKRARMTKKGSCHSNAEDGSIIETLVIVAEDLVQVIAKGILLPTNVKHGNLTGDDRSAVAGIVHSLECQELAEITKPCKSNVDRKNNSKTRLSTQVENGSADGIPHKPTPSNVPEIEKGKTDGVRSAKKEEVLILLNDGRQVGDGKSERKQSSYKDKPLLEAHQTTLGVQGSNWSLNSDVTQLTVTDDINAKKVSKVLPNGVACDSCASSIDGKSCEVHTSADVACSKAMSSSVQTLEPSAVDAVSKSFQRISSTPTEVIPPKNSSCNKTAKEFKLNPGAKIFSPSYAHHGSVSPAMPAVTSATYIPDNCPILPISTAQPEVEVSAYAPHSSVPVKFIPYSGLVAGNGCNDAQYTSTIVGHGGNRTLPLRYLNQYHPVQSGLAYIHSNSQNVMVGRLGPLVYVHPVSHDMVHSAPALSQVSTCPPLAQHQLHLPKHQVAGSVAPQTLQPCVTTPFIDGGQHPFSMPNHAPLSQPSFPVMHSIAVPGSNGFLSSKFS